MKHYLLFLTLILLPAGLFSQQPCRKDSIVVEKDSSRYKASTDVVSVEFAAIEGVTQYAVDQYLDVYKKVTEYYQQYKAGDKEIAASAKFMLPGTSDKFAVKIKESKPEFDPKKVHFVTSSGKEYEAVYMPENRQWGITVVGSAAGDGQELFVVYETEPGKYATVALLNIYSYEPLNRSVTLVPVNGQMNGLSKQSVESGLNKIYGKIGIRWTVNVLEMPFNYTPLHGTTFNVTGSGLFSTLTDDMKAINEAFKQSGNYQEDGLYLFILPFEASDKGEIAGTSGDMPLGSQFGYLFPSASDRTIAHEAGHGAFNLEHPFDRPLRNSFEKGALTNNLMDYTSGKEFAKLQWDQTRKPGLVIGLFQTDKSGMAFGATGTDFVCVNDASALVEIKKYKYVYLPDGRVVDLGDYQASGFFTEKDPNAKGALAAIRINGTDELHTYEGATSTRYGSAKIGTDLKVVTDKASQAVRIFIDKDKNTITVEQNGQSKTIIFTGSCDCQSYTSKGQEVIKSLNDAGFSKYTNLVNNIGLLVSKYEADKYDDYKKFTADIDPLLSKDEASLTTYYNSLKSYYEKHASAKLVTNVNCPDCPKYPVDGDAYWDEAGRNWVYTNGKWTDLSGEFIDNTDWKNGIDVQAIHKELYNYKFDMNRNSPLFNGYTDKALFEKTLWRTTQYLVVHILKKQWAADQVGNEIWIPLYGSIKESYFLNKVSEGDMMLKTESGFNAALGVSDVFLVKALATGLFKFTAWSGGKMLGQDVVYLAKKQLISAHLSFVLSTEAPLEAKSFLSKQGNNFIEIVSQADKKFIKYDLETGQTLIADYSDNAANTLQLTYKDFRKIPVSATTDDDIVKAVVDNVAKRGGFTVAQIDEYVRLATKNPEAKKSDVGKIFRWWRKFIYSTSRKRLYIF
jgi:hypothetical protein